MHAHDLLRTIYSRMSIWGSRPAAKTYNCFGELCCYLNTCMILYQLLSISSLQLYIYQMGNPVGPSIGFVSGHQTELSGLPPLTPISTRARRIILM